jgi:hypothetical protein
MQANKQLQSWRGSIGTFWREQLPLVWFNGAYSQSPRIPMTQRAKIVEEIMKMIRSNNSDCGDILHGAVVSFFRIAELGLDENDETVNKGAGTPRHSSALDPQPHPTAHAHTTQHNWPCQIGLQARARRASAQNRIDGSRTTYYHTAHTHPQVLRAYTPRTGRPGIHQGLRP